MGDVKRIGVMMDLDKPYKRHVLDYAASGKLVAEHLLSRGFRYLAALRQSDDVGVRLQANAMTAFAEKAGFDGWLGMVSIVDPKNHREWRQGVRVIEGWMNTWKLPLGLIVADTIWARVIIELAHERGWHCPEQIAIVCPHKNPEDGAMRGFAIAGNDRRFHPAKVDYLETGRDAHNQPQIDRKALKLTSIMVPEPVAYRYAWGRSPLANIKAEGDYNLVPLATQRSDDWPILSVPTGVVAENAEMPPSRADMGKISAALREMDKARRLREAELTIQELGKPK